MSKNLQIAAVMCLLLLLGGCGTPTGWLLTPVPIEQELEETVLMEDEGWGSVGKIAVVDVDGVLTNSRNSGLFGGDENPVSLFVEKVDKATRDKAVKAVIVRINSPGGGVTPSDIMYQRLITFREHRRVPVVAIIEDIGASGGYYVACAADKILAHPTSVVGSIGVLVQTMSFAGTMRMLGVEAKAVVSGPYKDMASPFKPLDAKDLKVLQRLTNTYYKRFLQIVQKARPELTGERLQAVADGRIFSSQDAKVNGLVDDLGYMEAAVDLAKDLGRIRRARVVIYHRPLGYRANVYSAAPMPPQINLVNISIPKVLDAGRPRFLYLWTGRGSGG